jgi:hypothetical protein
MHRFLPLLLFLGACSIQKLAIRASAPVFMKSSDGITREGNWDFFRASAPANIKLLELLWEQDPGNTALLGVLVKSYAGYAFAIPETLAFEDELKGVEESEARRDAITFYTRALDLGLTYLGEHEISRNDLLGDEKNLMKKLQGLGKEQVVPLLYTAQAWGSLINLQRDNIALIAQVPKVKLIFDRVCELDPQIEHNVCDIFYAQYEASRPKMLGGNPERGEELFRKAIAKNPQNLLIRMSYVQYLLLPAMDRDKYEREATELRAELAKWDDLNRDNLENTSSYRLIPELNLLNSIAKRRFLVVEKYKDKIF